MDERFSSYDLAAIIATDTAMTAKILRLANSAYYGFPRRIATVRDAVVLIGFRAVRATAVAAAVVDLFPKQGSTRFDADLFWAHCVVCGSVAEIIAKETNQARPDEAFTAGILHDIGRLVLAQYVPGPFDRALDQALERGAAMEAVETDVFGYDHTQLGAALTQRWNLPIEICTAIAGHHYPTVDPAEAPLTYVLAQSNRFCRSVGFWCGWTPRRAPGSTTSTSPPTRRSLPWSKTSSAVSPDWKRASGNSSAAPMTSNNAGTPRGDRRGGPGRRCL